MSDGRWDEDELLVAAGRLPRWAGALIALVVVGTAVAVVARAYSHDRAASRPPPTSDSRISVAVPPPLPANLGTVIAIRGGDEPVTAAAIDVDGLVAMRSDSLVALSLTGTVRVDRQLTGDAALAADAPAVQLFVDRLHGVGWAVSILEQKARVLTFDPTTLQPRQVTHNDFIVFDAALLDGRLYMGTRDGIAWQRPDGRSGTVPNVAGVVTSLAADPSRHRLLAVLSSAGNPLVAVRPSGQVSAVAGLDAAKAQVRVVSSAIWVAGFGHTAVLEQLDPRTLRPVKHVWQLGLGAGAVILGTGWTVLYVGSGTGGSTTWCVDARSALREDSFAISPLAVASVPGHVVAVVGQQLRALRPRARCAG